MTKQHLTPEQVADAILEMVRATSVGGARGDTAGLVMYGAYLRGFRRFKWIRQLAADGAGDEAVILTRSLVSLTARAAYVDQPADVAERFSRWQRYYKRHLQDRLGALEDLLAGGFDADADPQEIRDELAEYDGVPNLPNDRDLMQTTGMEAYYRRVYRLSSDYMHFSLGVAVDDLRGVQTVELEQGDAALADEALRLAILTYGLLLELSEKTVRHGLAARVLELVEGSKAGIVGRE